MDVNGDCAIDRQEWDVARCQSDGDYPPGFQSDEDYPPGLEPPSAHSSRAEGSGQTEMSLEAKVEAAIDRRFDEVRCLK